MFFLDDEAEKAVGEEHQRRHPSLLLHSVRLAAAMEVLFDVTDAGEAVTLAQLWESIEAVVPHAELREAVDVVRMLHICPLAAEEAYRRDIKGMRNLQEGRHALAGKTFHGKKGELYQRYLAGARRTIAGCGRSASHGAGRPGTTRPGQPLVARTGAVSRPPVRAWPE